MAAFGRELAGPGALSFRPRPKQVELPKLHLLIFLQVAARNESRGRFGVPSFCRTESTLSPLEEWFLGS